MKFLILILYSIFTLSAYSQHFNKQNSYIDALELARIFRQNTKLKDSNNQNLINAYYSILVVFLRNIILIVSPFILILFCLS